MDFQTGNGNGTGTNDSGNGVQTPQGTTQDTKPVVDNQHFSFSIDPRFKDLKPEEAYARTHQSIVTPLHQKIKELEGKTQKFDSYAESIGMLMENEELQLAFVRELNPKLVPQYDLDDQVKQALDKEFGSDFKPDREEANSDHWSKSAKYMRRMDSLYKDLGEKSKNPNKTYKEIMDEIKGRKVKETEARTKELNDFRSRHPELNEQSFQTFAQWAKALKYDDIYAHWLAINQFPRQGSVAGVAGSAVTVDQRMAQADRLFGR